ncbi:MAG: hypothetical protein ABIL58_05810 [Pseudomonadota bacterium]
MDISTLYKTIAPLGHPFHRSAIAPVKPPQDRKQRKKKRDRKPDFDEDVVVTLSGRAPDTNSTDA